MRSAKYVALLAAALSSGCSLINAYEDPALVGDWADKMNVGHKMRVDVEGDGKATIFVIFNNIDPNTSFPVEFKLDWEQRDDDKYRIDMECSNNPAGPCDGLNTRQECDANSDGDKLKCVFTGDFLLNAEIEWDED